MSLASRWVELAHEAMKNKGINAENCLESKKSATLTYNLPLLVKLFILQMMLYERPSFPTGSTCLATINLLKRLKVLPSNSPAMPPTATRSWLQQANKKHLTCKLCSCCRSSGSWYRTWTGRRARWWRTSLPEPPRWWCPGSPVGFRL